MLSSRPALIAFFLSLLAPVAVLTWLAVIVLQQAFLTGSAEAWMMAWVLVFVIGLPVAMLMLPVMSWLRTRGQKRQIVPNTDRKIPRMGR